MHPLHTSPYKQSPLAMAMLPGFACFFPVFAFRESGPWGLVLVVGALALILWMQIHPVVGNGIFARLKRVHADLPWFVAQPITACPEAARADLPAVLAKHGFALHELDGRRIGSWHDLAVELEALFGKHTFPSDPRQKAVQILHKAGAADRLHSFLRWNHAAESAARSPSLLVEFAAAYRHQGMPILIDLPAEPVEAKAPATSATLRQVGAPAEDPDRATLAEAPEGAWWKPQPGELTR
jgi:hypothetical protein